MNSYERAMSVSVDVIRAAIEIPNNSQTNNDICAANTRETLGMGFMAVLLTGAADKVFENGLKPSPSAAASG